jgi:hypothetical protein
MIMVNLRVVMCLQRRIKGVELAVINVFCVDASGTANWLTCSRNLIQAITNIQDIDGL